MFRRIFNTKIGCFGLSAYFCSENRISTQTISGIRETSIYSATEIDVKEFTNDIPCQEITNNNQTFEEITIKQNCPKFKKQYPKTKIHWYIISNENESMTSYWYKK